MLVETTERAETVAEIPWPCAPGTSSAALTPALTRRRLEVLATARNMLVDRMLGGESGKSLPSLVHVTIARVARMAGLSRRAVYDLWANQDAMHVDLLAEVLTMDEAAIYSVFDSVAAAPNRGQHPAVAVLDALGAAPPETAFDHVSLAFLTRFNDAEVGALFHSRLTRLVDGLAERLHGLDDSTMMRPGIEPQHIALILVAVRCGGLRQRRTLPDTLRANLPVARTPVSTLGATMMAVLAHSSRHPVATSTARIVTD